MPTLKELVDDIDIHFSENEDIKPEISAFCGKHNPLTLYNDLIEIGVEKYPARRISQTFERAFYKHIMNYIRKNKLYER